MKAIIQAYSPEEVERIARGEQTIKVCKTAPKEVPFKVYMYKKPYAGGAKIINEVLNGVYSGGKVVGEYVCENVEKFTVGSLRSDDIETLGCLSYTELINCFYKPWELDGRTVKQGKALHITAVKFYDEPKPLNSFKIACNKPIQCNSCEYRALVWHEDKKDFYYECRRPAITHAPRSWQYVEELNYGL